MVVACSLQLLTSNFLDHYRLYAKSKVLKIYSSFWLSEIMEHRTIFSTTGTLLPKSQKALCFQKYSKKIFCVQPSRSNPQVSVIIQFSYLICFCHFLFYWAAEKKTFSHHVGGDLKVWDVLVTYCLSIFLDQPALICLENVDQL